jgi:chromosome segregation ATPase
VTSSLIIEILLALLVPASGYATFVVASRANREQAQARIMAINQAAFGEARESYEAALKTVRDELSGVRAELVRVRESEDLLRREVARLRPQFADLSSEVTRLREANTDLRGQISTLERKPRGTV